MKNFFEHAARTALTGLAIFGFASAAFAHHVDKQPFVPHESALLLDALVRTGHQLYNKHPLCDKGVLGVASTQKQLLVCVENHQEGDYAEMADTLRHESIHLVQLCKGRKYGATSALLFPDEAEHFLNDAATWLHMPMDSYPKDKRFAEAEARVLAHGLDEHQIANLLVEYCGGTTGWE